MVNAYRRPFWLYPLFQIPLIFLGLCLLMAVLFWLLGFGRPSVAVAIALDLSSSTYQSEFNAPGTTMAQEVQAVKDYVDKNLAILKQPNQIKILGFADQVKPLTVNFTTDSQQIKQQLENTLDVLKSNPEDLGGGTNIDLAISEGTDALAAISDRCRELLIVTDGQATINSETITQAKEKNVKINAVVIGPDSPDIQQATQDTGGVYLISNQASNLSPLFTEKLFKRFNNNLRWVLFWLALAWMSLMWTLTMLLDRWIFQGLLKMRMDVAGKLALGNVFFWTVLTPLILWNIYQLLNLAAPFLGQC